ncbi:ABC transporter substrate-binding protein [Bordetella genomosp. 11]|uniref:Polyamine ABC transporter substrate-binding protein n=1 Tax=Bordetella genomosp. 11 TaxID=1416808 RepID=A0A261UG22_9BORD|nr:ABC transporter substrate-binding protein [Bordetella genomosp. 11]OZI60888.1 polyamine ABC transporter substrate-binding protein [Bordetella genomosp. 11]
MARLIHNALLAGTVGAACACAAWPANAAERITVAWYGGNWGEAFKACVADPYTKATGVTVTPEIGTSTTTLAKLQQQKNAPTIDVAWMDGGISELAQAAGVLDRLDSAAIPNMAHLLPQAIYARDGSTYAVGTGYYSLGLTYSTKEIATPPQTWKDLWKPEYAGAVAIPSPSNSAGVPFVLFMAKVWGVDPSNLDPVYKRLAALDTALLFDSSGAATNAFQSGEAVIGAHFNVGAWDLIDKKLPIGFAVPREGVWATDARLHLVKGAPNKAAAQKFIDTALTAQASSCLATRLYLGPSVQGVQVSPETARKLPWGEKGSVKDLSLLDWNEVNARRAEITDAWNRQVARKR